MAILGWVSPTVAGSAGAGYSLRRSGNFNSQDSSFYNGNNNCVTTTNPNSCSIGGRGNKLGMVGRVTKTLCSSLSSSWPSSSSTSSPWLTLPPTFEGGGKHMIYNFYNLADDKVESFDSYLAPRDHGAKFVGSSHGWLALFNQGGGEVFLSNPLTGRRIALPPLATLSDPDVNFRDDVISKLILSCDPEDEDEDDCHAVMTCGPRSRMAFCSLKQHTIVLCSLIRHFKTVWQWNSTSLLRHSALDPPYEDIVYPSCSNNPKELREVLCTPPFQLLPEDFVDANPSLNDNQELFIYEAWNIVHPHVRLFLSQDFRAPHRNCDICPWWKENKKLVQECTQIPYIICTGEGYEEGEQFFLVMRFVKGLGQTLYPTTVGFSVFKSVGFETRAMECSLDGLAMFVGMNHSFALPAEDFPGLKPDSIYFTDAHQVTSQHYRGHDIGIFDFHDKTFSPCYYPLPRCDGGRDDDVLISNVMPPPMWFTPTK